MTFDLPEGWKLLSLTNLAGIGGLVADGDWVESKDQDQDGDVRLIQLADIGDGEFQDRSSRFLTSAKAQALRCTMLEAGDLLIARMPDPLGRACLFPGVGQPSITAVDIFIWRPGKKAADPRWLMYAVNSPQVRSHLQSIAGGTTRQRISGGNLKRLALPTPPKAIQQRIVAALESLSGRSKNARDELDHIPKLVDRYKQAVLACAFRGDLTADWRKDANIIITANDFLRLRLTVAANRRNSVGYGRDERTALIDRDHDLSATLRVAEADNIPTTWTWCGLGEVFGVYVGATPSRKEAAYWNGSIPWVSSGEVAFCRIGKTTETISDAGLRNASTRLHPPGTVLLGMIGEGRTRGQAAILDIEACNNQNCAAIRVSESEYPPEYVYWYLQAVYEQTRTASAGNNQPALNKDRVQRLPIPLAPPEEAAQVVRAIESRLEPLQHLEAEVLSAHKLLGRLDARILEQAFRGELIAPRALATAPRRTAAD